MKLPIDVVPNTDPPMFKWTNTVNTLTGPVVQDCSGILPPSCEVAVAALVKMAKDALRENAMLTGQVDSLNKREEQRVKEGEQRVAAAATLKPQTTPATTTNKK